MCGARRIDSCHRLNGFRRRNGVYRLNGVMHLFAPLFSARGALVERRDWLVGAARLTLIHDGRVFLAVATREAALDRLARQQRLATLVAYHRALACFFRVEMVVLENDEKTEIATKTAQQVGAIARQIRGQFAAALRVQSPTKAIATIDGTLDRRRICDTDALRRCMCLRRCIRG